MNKFFVLIAYLSIVKAASSGRFSRKVDCNNNGVLTESQSRYLEEIQVLARKGGMPEEDWKAITQYNEETCYELDCLESGLINHYR